MVSPPDPLRRKGLRLRAEALPESAFDAWRSATLNRLAEHRAGTGAMDAAQARARAAEVLDRNLPLGLRTPHHHVITLHADPSPMAATVGADGEGGCDADADADARARDEPVAWSWLRVRDEEQGRVAFAFDVHVRRSRADDCGVPVIEAVEAIAGHLGAEVLWHNVFAADHVMVSMLRGRGYDLSVSQLRLALGASAAAGTSAGTTAGTSAGADVPGGIELRPMTAQQFDAWFDGQEEAYAAELTAAGTVGPIEAPARAAADMAQLL
ncbi:MAG TPA: hypothetical protein VF661_00245, partial [Actinomycetales bacterium]